MQSRREERRLHLAPILNRLLHSLKGWVRVYPRSGDAEMPDHDVVWVTDAAERAIRDAIAQNPVLWAHAVPENCCIVPRHRMEAIVGNVVTEMLIHEGVAHIQNAAAISRDQDSSPEKE